MKRTFIEIYRGLVESAVREIRDQFHWLKITFEVLFAGAVAVLDKFVGESWLTIAFMTYLGVKCVIHGVIAWSIRVRTGKWPGPRLQLTLANLAMMTIMGGVWWKFGISNTTAQIQIPLFLTTALVCEYFSDYRRNRRAVRREVKRFTTELGIGN